MNVSPVLKLCRLRADVTKAVNEFVLDMVQLTVFLAPGIKSTPLVTHSSVNKFHFLRPVKC